jgi:hypothetical protein
VTRAGGWTIAALLAAVAAGCVGPPVRGSPPPPELRVLLFGDFGDDTPQQRAVAAGLVRAAREAPFDLGFSLGDNVYECGPDVTVPGARECRFASDGNTVAPGFVPPRDARFERLFEAPLAELPPFPLHLALGNHDVASHASCAEGGLAGAALSRLRACLSVAHRGPRWSLPARHYVVDRGPARFVVIDSNLVVRDYGGFSFEDERAFVAEAARTAGDRLLFVIAHHPAATAGDHVLDFDRPQFLERLRLLQRAAGPNLAAWFAGHDHDLQHLRAEPGHDVFVSGNGARARPHERFERVTPDGASLRWASTRWGHATLEVSRTHWSVRFDSDRGEPLYCCSAAVPGRCLPTACGGTR